MIAIIGSGLAGFVAYATLRHGGYEAAEIAVFGDDPDPASSWRPRAAAIRQRRMRSESDGHCHPRSFPGLAPREAFRRRSLMPLLDTVCDRYRPTVDDFLAHVQGLREISGWDTSFRPARVERIAATEGGFTLDRHGPFRHVLLALGHPGLKRPAELARDERVVHAYEPHDYAPDVAIVGAGMAAATEWLNALGAGSRVTSVRRREPARRPLNIARPLFSKRGLASFHSTSRARRAELLREYGEPSYPPGRSWDEPLEEAMREGRFRVASVLDGAAQVICATGFEQGFALDPLLSRLAEDHALETEERWIVLEPDGAIGVLSDDTRTLAVTGVAAQWAYPAADTLVGMKYFARRFVRRTSRCRTR